MAQIVVAGTGAARAEVWLRVGAELRSVARWPQDSAASPSPMPTPPGDLPEFGEGEQRSRSCIRGDMLGAIVVQAPAGDPITTDKEKLIANLAAQAGLVLRNVRLLEDICASRQRIVTAQDAAARRLERNIHDGAQQQLVALAIKTGLADSLVGHDDAEAHQMLSQIQAEIKEALSDLRDLARGIYPPLLADLGLVAALQAQARKSALSAVVDGDGLGRYPQEAETAVYFCAIEALQIPTATIIRWRSPIGLASRSRRCGSATTAAGSRSCWPLSRRWRPGRGWRSASRAPRAMGSGWRGRWPSLGCW